MVMHVRRPIPGMALLWHSSGAPIIAAYSTPLTPISLLVSAVTNPKSLWATPWWLALGEQMASVCWAAIKERKSAEQSERERERESGSGSRGACRALLCCTSTVQTHVHMRTYILINRLTCVSVHTQTHASLHPSFFELSIPLTKTNAISILTSRMHSRNTVQGLKALDPTGEKSTDNSFPPKI